MHARIFAAASASLTLVLALAACGTNNGPGSASTGDSTPPATAVPTPDGTPETPPQGTTTQSPDTITELLAKNTDLAGLKTAVGASGLDVTLGQPGPYTVFAPNNDAFAKLGTKVDTLLEPASKDELANILKFHVVSGEVHVNDLKNGQLLTTVQGTRLRVVKKGTSVKIGNSVGYANIVAADSDASNGVIDTIDTVLTPKPAK